jgi:hypothetical protein
MARECCPRPIPRIIKVAEIEAGILGLDQALRKVYTSGLADEEEIQRALLKWIKEFGNYITPSRENDYRKALLREYREYLLSVKREGPQESDSPQKC